MSRGEIFFFSCFSGVLFDILSEKREKPYFLPCGEGEWNRPGSDKSPSFVKNVTGGIQMFREMRRKRQQLSEEECEVILKRGTSGVLAVSGDDGYPYAVPLSYVYDGGRLFFHCAKSGHKMDAMLRCSKVSFCVIDQDRIVPEEYTTYFRSVIAFGVVRILEDDNEKRAAVRKLALKYAPDDSEENREQAIQREWKPLCMLEMEIAHMTGKEAIELTAGKEN